MSMRMKLSIGVVVAMSCLATVSAHIMVSPPQSKAGAAQKYELRVHNEAKVATASIELAVPDGVNVTEVIKPKGVTYTTKSTDGRIVSIMWRAAVEPTKYMALPFTATNPDRAGEVHWNVRETMADGTVVDWSDKPGAKEKASVTKLAVATP
jgi:uncharacterized protein YcnI